MKRLAGLTLLAMFVVPGCRNQEPPKPQSASQPLKSQAAISQPAKWVRKGDFMTAFGGEAPLPSRQDPHIFYSLNPAVEQFFVHVPGDYTGETAYGLIVFTDAADDSRQLPDGWQKVLDRRNYLYVSVQNAGNDQNIRRRLGLAALAALEMMSHYKIDPSRVYAAGYSGGARMSGMLGFYQNDVFTGTIQNCGADFYKPVPRVIATSSLDTQGQPYGVLDATSDEVASARHVRFVLITGSGDFRRGNIVDIFNGGFAHDGFQAKLFDVPGMGHDTADIRTLSAALDFLEQSP